MLITKTEMFPEVVAPETYDRIVAARTSSLFCFVAAVWFFISPWAYFGVSAQRSAWNAWIVGGLMIVASLVRLRKPKGATVFSVVNILSGLWVLVSPFVFGYTDQTNRLINTISVGAFILGFSILSLLITKDVNSRIGTPDA